MAVAHDASSEFPTGTTPNTSAASFSWTHTPVGTPRGVLVFTFNTNANAFDATSVTYGGVNVPAVASGQANDTSTEPGSCKVWFLGSGIPTGAQTVVVNRNNNTNEMYAIAITATGDCQLELLTAPVIGNNNAALAAVAIDSGTRHAQRYGATYFGASTVPAPATGSTALQSMIVATTRTASAVRETTPGTGSRNVGYTQATDDRASIHLALVEVQAVCAEGGPGLTELIDAQSGVVTFADSVDEDSTPGNDPVDAQTGFKLFADFLDEAGNPGVGSVDTQDGTLESITDRSTADVSNLGPIRTPIKRRVDFARSGVLDGTVDETVSAADSQDANQVSAVNVPETIASVVDSQNANLVSTANAPEVVIATVDSQNAGQVSAVSVPETASLQDTQTEGGGIQSGDVAETITALDSQNSNQVSAVSVSDIGIALTDSQNSNQVSAVSVPETASLQDTQTEGGGLQSGDVPETVTSTDSQNSSLVSTANTPEAVIATQDSQDATLLSGRSSADVSNLGPLRTPIKRRTGFDRAGALSDTVEEAVTSTDVTAATTVYAATVAESSTLVDSSDTEFNRLLADVSGLGPLRTPIKRRVDFARVTEHVGSLDESATAVDAQSTAAVFTVTVTELGSASDVAGATSILAAAVAELSGIIDVTETVTNRDTADISAAGPLGMPFKRYTSFARESISDTIESAVINDAQDAVLIIGGAVIEAGSGSDTYTALLIITSAVVETASAVESQNTDAINQGSVAETVTSTDLQDTSAVYNAAQAETSTSVDETEANFLGQQSDTVEESTTCTDSQDSTGTFGVAVAETSPVSDMMDRTFSTTDSVAETTNLVDDQSAFQAFMSQVLESVNLVDVTDTTPEFGGTVEELLDAEDYSSTSGLSLEVVAEVATLLDTEIAFTEFLATVTSTTTALDVQDSTKIVVGVNLDGDRTYIVPLEIRRYDVEAEDRMYVVPDQERSVPV